MGRRGPKPISRKALHDLANELYWAFRQLGEGYSKDFFDRHRYEQIKRDPRSRNFLNDEEAAEFERRDSGIRAARLSYREKESRFRQLQAKTNLRQLGIVYEKAYRCSRMPGKPEVVRALLTSHSAAEVRQICKGAFRLRVVDVYQPMSSEGGPRCVLAGQHRTKVLNWPIINGDRLPNFLLRYAEQFVVAKTDARYPASTRMTSELKRLWYLSRTLAGASLGITTRSAINVLGSLKPKESFEPSDAGNQPKGRYHVRRKR